MLYEVITIAARYGAIMLGTAVTKVEAGKAGISVSFEGKQAPAKPSYNFV